GRGDRPRRAGASRHGRGTVRAARESVRVAGPRRVEAAPRIALLVARAGVALESRLARPDAERVVHVHHAEAALRHPLRTALLTPVADGAAERDLAVAHTDL